MKVIGLMSGTSADGIDAALVDIQGAPPDLQWDVLGFVEMPFPKNVRDEILALCEVSSSRVDAVCGMNVALGEWFAEATLAVCKKAQIEPEEIALIGSHGQTIHHLPNTREFANKLVRSTLQIGDPSVIAQRTGITTVSDFRLRDMAVGGQGAPLVPLVDFLLFRSATKGRILLNIGGIANLTVLPKNCQSEDVFAFDAGPGNMIIDGVVHVVTQGEMSFDENGELAQQGQIVEGVLTEVLSLPFFQESPPKSTGRELFGQQMVSKFVSASDSAEDVIATATAFTIKTIVQAIEDFVLKHHEIDELIVSGGGALNPVLMQGLASNLELEVKTTADLGMRSECKEAVAFAILAYETFHGRPGNVPRVTGADLEVVLGSLTPGRRWPNI